MPNFLDLQTSVKSRIIDLRPETVGEVPDLINAAMRRLQHRHNFKVMEAQTGPLITQSGSRQFTVSAVPSDFKDYRGNPARTDNLGGVVPVLVAPNRENAELMFGRDSTTDIGAPEYILDGEPDAQGVRSWEVFPFPDGASDFSDGEYRILIPYWRFLPALSADTDTNWFTNNANEFLVADATANAFSINWDLERSAEWSARAQAFAQEAISLDKRFRMSGFRTLVPHTGALSARNRG